MRDELPIVGAGPGACSTGSESGSCATASPPTASSPTASTSPAARPARRLPPWLKRPLPSGEMQFTSAVIEDLRLETVCESAKCPNRTECWAQRTATFMILGNVCTRPCGFCSVPKGRTEVVQLDEPERVAEAAARLGLSHVVITSVTRDDLPDGGAEHFRRCVLAVRERTGAAVEVLVPDFLGRRESVATVMSSQPDVFNHNTETVPRLYHRVRRNAEYRRTLDVLAYAKSLAPERPVKSGLMLGLGETIDEVLEVCADLRRVGCDMLTVGQYLQPSPAHLPVERYVPPAEFDELGRAARKLGFRLVASGPFVRSSYHAGEMASVLEGGGFVPADGTQDLAAPYEVGVAPGTAAPV